MTGSRRPYFKTTQEKGPITASELKTAANLVPSNSVMRRNWMFDEPKREGLTPRRNKSTSHLSSQLDLLSNQHHEEHPPVSRQLKIDAMKTEETIVYRNPYDRKSVTITIEKNPGLKRTIFKKASTPQNNTYPRSPLFNNSPSKYSSTNFDSPNNFYNSSSKGSIKLSPLKLRSSTGRLRTIADKEGDLSDERRVKEKKSVHFNERVYITFDDDENDKDYQHFLNQRTNILYSHSPEPSAANYEDPYARPLYLRAPKRKTQGDTHIKREYLTTLRLLGFDDIDNNIDLETLSISYERRENDFRFIDPSLKSHNKHVLHMLRPSEYVRDTLEEKKNFVEEPSLPDLDQLKMERLKNEIRRRKVDLSYLKKSYEQYSYLQSLPEDQHTVKGTIESVPPSSQQQNQEGTEHSQVQPQEELHDGLVTFFLNEEKVQKEKLMSQEERVSYDSRQISLLSKELLKDIPMQTGMTIARIFANPHQADRISREQYISRARKYKTETRKKKQREQDEYEKAIAASSSLKQQDD